MCTRYTNVQVNISENQKQNLKRAMENGDPLSIRLDFHDLCGDDVLALTNSQMNRIIKACQNGKVLVIKMSKAQLRYNMKIEDVFCQLFYKCLDRWQQKHCHFCQKQF